MRIREKADLREAYRVLRFAEENSERPGVREYIQGLKREIREYTHRAPEPKCIWDGGDSYTERKDVPAEVESLEEAEEWFDCVERIDCTGQAFTSWHHIGILGGRMVCWHHVCYDV